jgi:PAS domain S-box-containing protein
VNDHSKALRRIDTTSLIDGMPFGVAILDTSFRVISMNHTLEALTGFSLEEALNIPCQYIIRNSLFPREFIEQSVLEENKKRQAEANILNRDREMIPVSITVSPLSDSGGRTVGLIEAVQDISSFETHGESGPPYDEYGDLIGHSAGMQKIKEILPIIARTDSSVLITGETGTGKDLVASIIHRASPRAHGPFIKVNCGALPETLLESELFGHVRGAFTGAVRDKPGRFQLAENGTIYLTEIGDLYLPLQVKLLTVLDDKEIVPVGGTRNIKADVRIIAATHRDLESMVSEKSFRDDLLYRLKVVRIDLPSLRDRGEDIRLLLEHFLGLFRESFGKKIDGFSREALAVLLQYPYPGNVRELRNIVEYATSVCLHDTIRLDNLPDYMHDPKSGAPAAERIPAHQGFSPTAIDESGKDWQQIERRLIADALIQCKGNRSKAAEMLGWGRSTLWRKMKKHGL